MGKCPKKAQGMVKIFVKWIPAGSEKSKFDLNGNKKEVPGQVVIPNKREQQKGQSGTLEVYCNTYQHPKTLQFP
jgi:hypothetical protein